MTVRAEVGRVMGPMEVEVAVELEGFVMVKAPVLVIPPSIVVVGSE